MSEKRYITVPTAIEIETLGACSFADFITGRTADGVFGRNMDGILSGLSIRQAFKEAAVGAAVPITLGEWTLLCESVRTPVGGYNPELAYQVVSHMRAVLDAPTTEPGGA